MAEHQDMRFEHEIEKKLKALDDKIVIPEIPDAQNIFDRAEKKNNVIPFGKIAKYTAAAAAVVLVVLSFPVFTRALSADEALNKVESAPEEPFIYSIFDSFTSQDVAEAEICNDEEEPVSEVAEDPSEPVVPEESEESELEKVLSEFFANSRMETTSSVFSSSFVSEEELKQNSNDYNEAAASKGEAYFTDEVKTIEEYLNKKRSVILNIEKDSVSVILRDNAIGEEIINAFWVEGTYESSYTDGDYYIINVIKNVGPGSLYLGEYLPMAGDASGTYTIPEESIIIPDEITKGAISMIVEVNIGTGEYNIYASLV